MPWQPLEYPPTDDERMKPVNMQEALKALRGRIPRAKLLKLQKVAFEVADFAEYRDLVVKDYYVETFDDFRVLVERLAYEIID